MQELGATKIAELIVDLPSGKAAYEEAVAPIAEKLGLDVTPFYYVQASVDWTSFAATVMATNPDGIDMVAPTDADCTAAVAGVHERRVRGRPPCRFLRGVPHRRSTPTWSRASSTTTTSTSRSMNDIPAKVQGDLDIYREYMEEGAPDAIDTVYGPLGFSIAVDAASMLRQVPGDELTPAGVKAALPTATGIEVLHREPVRLLDADVARHVGLRQRGPVLPEPR